jgi:hypothetical protein
MDGLFKLTKAADAHAPRQNTLEVAFTKKPRCEPGFGMQFGKTSLKCTVRQVHLPPDATLKESWKEFCKRRRVGYVPVGEE